MSTFTQLCCCHRHPSSEPFSVPQTEALYPINNNDSCMTSFKNHLEGIVRNNFRETRLTALLPKVLMSVFSLIVKNPLRLNECSSAVHFAWLVQATRAPSQPWWKGGRPEGTKGQLLHCFRLWIWGVSQHITVAAQRTDGTRSPSRPIGTPSWMLNKDPQRESDFT